MPQMLKASYERVAEAAEALRAEGKKVTATSVLKITGGSMTNVLEHLQAWKAENPAPVQVADIPSSVPQAMAAAYHAALQEREDAIRAAVADELSELRENNQGLKKQAKEAETELESCMAALENAQKELEAVRLSFEGERKAMNQVFEALRSELRGEARLLQQKAALAAIANERGQALKELAEARQPVDRGPADGRPVTQKKAPHPDKPVRKKNTPKPKA